MGTKTCNSCLEPRDEEKDFNYRYKVLGIRHPTCKYCQKKFRKNWYEGDAKERHLANVKERKHAARDVAREYVYDYLSTHPCEGIGPEGCPYHETDPRVLEFHHVGGKDMAVSAMVAGGYPISTIQAEINKCRILCANCHRKLTVEDRGWFRKKR